MTNVYTKNRKVKIDRQFIFTTIAGAGKLALVDNNDLWRGHRYPLYTESKLSELFNPVVSGKNILPDIFDENEIITPIASKILGDIGIKLSIERHSLSATADISLFGGEIFTYTSVLRTDKSTFIAIHPDVEIDNSFRKKADLNLLAWYLIFKTFNADIKISSDDRALLSSAFAFFKISY